MKTSMVVDVEIYYWAWGDGGVEIKQDASGPYPVALPPKEPGLLNSPQPHFHNFTHYFEEGLREVPEEYSGWVTKSHEAYMTRAQKKTEPQRYLDSTYFFLKRVQGDKIIITQEENQHMRFARHGFRDGTDKDDPVQTNLIISEIAFYTREMKFVGSINPLIVLGNYDQYELSFVV